MSKEQYDKLVKFVDDTFNKDDFNYPEPEPDPEHGLIIMPSAAEMLGLEPFTEYPFGAYSLELATILDSRIFINGQLKGATGYDRFYQINDFVDFIYLLCHKMHDYFPFDEEYCTAYALHNLVEAIENAEIEIRDLLGKHESTQIKALKGKIKAWLETSKDSSPQPIFIPTERNLSDFIFALFKKHIPGAPNLIIFERLSEFLNLFGIKVKPKALNMREYRKRKASPKK